MTASKKDRVTVANRAISIAGKLQKLEEICEEKGIEVPCEWMRVAQSLEEFYIRHSYED